MNQSFLVPRDHLTNGAVNLEPMMSWRNKSKITAVADTLFFWRYYQSSNHQNLLPSNEHAVGTAIILDFFLPHPSTEQSFINQELKFSGLVSHGL